MLYLLQTSKDDEIKEVTQTIFKNMFHVSYFYSQSTKKIFTKFDFIIKIYIKTCFHP